MQTLADRKAMPTRRRSVKLGLSMTAETPAQVATAELEHGHRLSWRSIELPALPRYVHIIIFFALAVVVGPFQDFHALSSTFAISVPNSLYIPGGGISGIAYRFGQLQNIPDEELDNETTFCYSAGCLALVMRRQHWSTEKLVTVATGVREKWYAGDIVFHDALKKMIDEMLKDIADDDLGWMSNMVILTSEVSSSRRVVGRDQESSSLDDFLTRDSNSTSFSLGTFGGLTSVANIPKSKQMLRTMLMESAWIPFVSGRSLTHEHAVDGGLTMMFHPKCTRAVKQGVGWALYANFLNPFISVNSGRRLVTAGKEYANGIRYN